MDLNMKGLSVLGSTGSIGTQTLDVVRAHPDKLKIVGLAANSNYKLLLNQIEEFKPQFVYLNTYNTALNNLPDCVHVVNDISELIINGQVEIVVTATTGYASVIPTLAAVDLGIDIALANKESIVMLGPILMNKIEKSSSSLLPLDSEPSAIWQCIRGENSHPEKLLITASGGAFRDVDIKELKNVTKNDALKHPTWNMGAKITVDSATMMNKAFEVIEAKWLFNVDWDQIEVAIHPESIIHSMVEFEDGVTKAQLSVPDMRLPIQHALFFPERIKSSEPNRFRPTDTKQLTFKEIDRERYPCFHMAIDYAKRGDTWPSALCGADEGAVDKFLEGSISFVEIESVIKHVMELHRPYKDPNVDQIIDAYRWAKTQVEELIGTKTGTPS
tara:strand:+ start:25042 stop:26202 length:1161 start_codon:yes stop_codon:yes gene_type:complete